MNKEYLKINTEAVEHLLSVSNGLSQIDTRGDSTILMAKLREVMSHVINEIRKDNMPDQDTDGLVADNTQESKKDNSGG